MRTARVGGWCLLALAVVGLATAPALFFSVPVPPPPAPRKLTGRLIVPPSQLFGGLLVIARGNQAPFTPSQVEEVRRLLQQWQRQEHLAEQALQDVGRQLSRLDPGQRAVIEDTKRADAGAPAWDRLLDMLATRAGSTPPVASASPAASDGNYGRLPPGVVVTGLLRLEGDAALALRPAQAAALLGPMRAWRARDEAFLDLTIRLGEALDARQRDMVRAHASGARTSASDVLQAMPPASPAP